jgi:hypothetical protein
MSANTYDDHGADEARLRAEVDRLKAMVEYLHDQNSELKRRVAREEQ